MSATRRSRSPRGTEVGESVTGKGPRQAHQSAGRPYRTRRSPRSRKSAILTIAMWLCAAYFLLPLLWLTVSTGKSDGTLFASFGLSPGSFAQLMENTWAVFTTNDGEFTRWILNTAGYGITSALIAVVLATMAGYSLAKYKFAGDKVIFSLILGAVMIPGAALAIPTYLLFAQVGITNTALAVILPSILSPFGVFLMTVYSAEAVDDSLIEAARVDGASEFRIFWSVTLRLLAPAIVTVFLLALVSTWNDYLLPLIMLNDPELFTITVGLAQWLVQSDNAGGETRVAISTLLTGAFFAIIPLIIAFLTLQRYWQAGLSTGAVKG